MDRERAQLTVAAVRKGLSWEEMLTTAALAGHLREGPVLCLALTGDLAQLRVV